MDVFTDDDEDYAPSNSDSSLGHHDDPDRLATQRKRRASASQAELESKKARYGYNREYHKLFNVFQEGVCNRVADQDNNNFEASLIKSSWWSREEKRRFFAALDTCGRDNVRALADAVESKSEVEVEVYMQLLRKGSLEHPFGIRSSRNDIVDCPAAAEIPQNCETELDKIALGLDNMQTAWEESVEYHKYGPLWRLDETTDVAEKLEEYTHNSVDFNKLALNAVPLRKATDLLLTKNMMALSRMLFMNSKDPEYNYMSYAEDHELPAMRLTALLDFYNLVVLVTKRLVSTANFMALSRLKATGSRGQTGLKPYVKLGDVIAALKTLNMKQDNPSWLINSIRANKITVHEQRRDTQYKLAEAIPDDLLETRLQKRISSINQRKGNLDRSAYVQGFREQSDEARYENKSSEVTNRGEETTLDEGIMSSEERDQISKQDEYLELVDRKQSQLEVQRLQSIYDTGENGVESTKVLSIPSRRGLFARLDHDAHDWRVWVGYQAIWERFDAPIPDDRFKRSRRLSRTERESKSGQSSSSSSPQSDSGKSGLIFTGNSSPVSETREINDSLPESIESESESE